MLGCWAAIAVAGSPASACQTRFSSHGRLIEKRQAVEILSSALRASHISDRRRNFCRAVVVTPGKCGPTAARGQIKRKSDDDARAFDKRSVGGDACCAVLC